LSEWLLKSLGNAAASAALVGATKDTVFGRPRLSDVAAKLSRRNPPGRSGIVFGLGQARGTAAFPGPASVPKDSLLGDAAPSALRKNLSFLAGPWAPEISIFDRGSKRLDDDMPGVPAAKRGKNAAHAARPGWRNREINQPRRGERPRRRGMPLRRRRKADFHGLIEAENNT
jgi:hypothetical protein